MTLFCFRFLALSTVCNGSNESCARGTRLVCSLYIQWNTQVFVALSLKTFSSYSYLQENNIKPLFICSQHYIYIVSLKALVISVYTALE